MKRALCFLAATVFFILTALLVSEWFKTGPSASQASIDAYHFGSEAMRYHGGAKYESAEVYSAWTGVECIATLAICGFFLIAGIMKKRSFGVAGITCALGMIATNWMIG